MRLVAFASLACVLIIPVLGHAAPTTSKAITAGKPIILVQGPWEGGWWERQHRERLARERYWHLPPPELDRYNQLQAEINELRERRRAIDERIRDVEREQHEILSFGPR